MIGVRLIGLMSRDTSALAEFYRDVLGLPGLPTDTAALGSPSAAGSAEPRRW